MTTNEWALFVSAVTLIFTAVSTYITYKGYGRRKRGKPSGKKRKHSKSNRISLAKITVAFTIKVTKS